MKFVNLSILLLSTLRCQYSPFINAPCMYQKGNKIFSHLFISKSFSSFFTSYLNFHDSTLIIQKSNFFNFLSRSISIQNNYFLVDQIYEFSRQDFEEENIEIWNCIFRKFNLPDQTGAAIYTESNIQLFNVLFSEINSKSGSFYSEGQINAHYVTFDKVEASESACFSSNSSRYEINLESILIKNAKSDKSFAFSMQRENHIHFSFSNATNCESTKSIGMLKCVYGDFLMKYFFLSFSESPENTISFLSSSNHSQFSNCLFHSITYSNNLIKVVDMNDLCLESCFFSKIKYKHNKSFQSIDGQYRIYSSNCTSLIINSCCFDSTSFFISSQFKNINSNNNLFKNKKCFFEISSLNQNNNIGYSYQRTSTYNHIRSLPSPTYNLFLHKNFRSFNIDSALDMTFSLLCLLIFLMICSILHNLIIYCFPQYRNIFSPKDSKEML